MFQPFDKTGDIQIDLPRLLALRDALDDPDPIAVLANAAALLHWYLDDVNWVGFYLWKQADGELVLGPFQGLPACIRIKPGRGVCGMAYASQSTLLVDDVTRFPGHIACDAGSRTELVIPLFRGKNVEAVLDIDSPRVGRFNQHDADALEQFCEDLLQPL